MKKQIYKTWEKTRNFIIKSTYLLLAAFMAVSFLIFAYKDTEIKALETAKMILFWDGFASDGTTPLSVPAGWTDISSTYNNRFPRGDAPANTLQTGGSSSHTQPVTSTTMNSSNYPNVTQNGLGNTISSTAHGHGTVSGATAAASNNNPLHRTLRIIQFNGVPSTIPSGAIALFDADGVPGGWTRQSAQDNRMIKISTTAGSLGGADTHSHTVTWPSLTAPGGQVNPAGSGFSAAAAGHTHACPNSPSCQTSTSSETSLPPHIKPLLAKANSSMAVPDGMIAMFDANPGGGWTVQSNAGGIFHQQFMRPAAAFDGNSSGTSTHSHPNLVSPDTPVCSSCSIGAAAGGGGIGAGVDHTHKLTAAFAPSRDHTPEYINFVIAKKSVPSMMMFWDGSDASIPVGWSRVTEFENRLPRGESPGNYGDTGGYTQHNHTNETVEVDETASIQTGAGISGAAAAPSHSHSPPAVSSVGNATSFPAYRTLKLIKYDAGIPNIIPAGAITIFDDSPGIPDLEESPGNPFWSQYSAQNNRVIAIDDNSNDSVGSTTSLGTGSDTHTHQTGFTGSLGASSGTANRNCIDLLGACVGGNGLAASSNGHTHSAPGNTISNPGSTLPPYVGVLMAKANFNTATLSTGLTAMFTGDPGSGWINHSSEGGKYYQKFFRPQATYNESGGGSPHHTHTVTATSGAASAVPLNRNVNGSGVAGNGHTHTVTAEYYDGDDPGYVSDENKFLPPFFNVIVAEKVDFKLEAYQWFEDTDDEDTSDPWSILDVPLSSEIPTLPSAYRPPDLEDELRLRVRILVNNNTLNVGDVNYKLQYKAGTDASCTSGSWEDIGEENTGEIWRFASSSESDGEPLSTVRISSDVPQVYSRSNPTAFNVQPVPAGETMEWDFHIQHNGAAGATWYSFRIVEDIGIPDDGILLSEYDVCPTLVTKPQTVNQLRHGNFFESDGSERGFSWAD